MGEEAEALYSQDEYYAESVLREQREMEIEETADMLAKMSDTELLDYLCKQGKNSIRLKLFRRILLQNELKTTDGRLRQNNGKR